MLFFLILKYFIIQITPETELTEGNFVQLSCNITAKPPAIVDWYYPNGTIVDASVNIDKLRLISLKEGTLKYKDESLNASNIITLNKVHF